MSISSEISRISGNVSDSLAAVAAKGVTVPSGSNSDDLAGLIAQISGGGTGAISIVDTADSGGGTVRTITAVDISDTTAAAADVASGKYFYAADGTKTQGSVASKSSSDLTASNLTVNVPAGLYSQAASKTLSDANLITSNIKNNVEIFGVLGSYTGGGGGLVYETGTYTPSNDVARPTISFANSHTNPPISIIFSDATETSNLTTYTNWLFIWTDFYQISNTEITYSSSENRCAWAYYVYRGNSTSTVSTSNTAIIYPFSDTESSSSSYYRRWVTNSEFYPYCASTSRYWRSGRTYKWIAVWKPTS